MGRWNNILWPTEQSPLEIKINDLKESMGYNIREYIKEDISMYPDTLLQDKTKPFIPNHEYARANHKLEIKKVHFNDPATIVFWSDDTKTVVKATNEAFDKEKGLAMAITKKFFGNQGNYYNQIKKWLE